MGQSDESPPGVGANGATSGPSIDEKPSVAPAAAEEEPMEEEDTSASTSPRTCSSKGDFPIAEVSTPSMKEGPSTEDIVSPLSMDLVRKQPGLDQVMDWENEGSERSSVKRQRGSCSSESSDPNDPLRDVVYPLLLRVLGLDLSSSDSYLTLSPESFSYMDTISFILDHVISTVLTSGSYEEALTFTSTLGSRTVTWDPDIDARVKTVLPLHDVSSLSLMYLLETFERIEEELSQVHKIPPFIPAGEMLDDARSQVINYIVLLLTNAFDTFGTITTKSEPCETALKTPLTASVLTPFAYYQKPRGLISYLVVKLFNSDGVNGDFRLIFEPLLDQLWREMSSSSSIVDDDHKLPLQTLTELCDIKVQNQRPICQLLVQMYNWSPSLLPHLLGREISRTSFMAPFLSFSSFAEDDPKIVDTFFSSKSSPDQNKLTSALIQSKLSWIRTELHSIIHYVLLDNVSRTKMLLFISQVLKRNEKRSRYHLDERVVAGDGFMLNLMSVLQNLAKKIKVDRIDLSYPYHGDTLYEIRSGETRLKMTLKEVEEWTVEMKSDHAQQSRIAESGDLYPASFHTQCYFLTLEAHHLAIMPSIRKYTRRIRAIREYSRIADELAATAHVWENNPILAPRNQAMIKRWKDQVKKLTKAKFCSDAGLLDQSLLTECLNFYCQHMSVLMKCVTGSDDSLPSDTNPFSSHTNPFSSDTNPFSSNISLPLPIHVPKLFASLPEWYIEDVADFLLFTVQHMPSVVDTNTSPDLVLFLIVFVSSNSYFSNPYLVAKIIEVIFVSSPILHTFTERFYLRIMSHPLAQTHLPPALMKFYVDVESTGASSEFYDKFTIRYHLSVIIKSMWNDSIHQKAIISESRNGNQFVRFVNMLMNDTTFLLDESLESLKRIHDVQEAMDKKEQWSKIPVDQQTARQRQLQSDERQCRSYLTLATETVDMFHYLTTEIKEPFCRPVRYEHDTTRHEFHFLKRY